MTSKLPDLDNLTQDQLDTLAAIKEKWTKIAGSTDPANRPEAEEGIRQAYRDAGYNPPQYIVWVDSPLSATMALGIVPAAIDAALEAVAQAVQVVIDKPSGEMINEKFSVPEVPADMRAVEDWWRAAIYGQHSAGYFSFLDGLKELGVDDVGKIEGPLKVAMNAGWWWPTEDVVIVCERPSEIYRDPQSRLHREDGPAIVYRDGWGIYLWHGTQVPKELIEGTWTVDDILKQENLEVRRCGFEKFGWDRVVAEAKWNRVDVSPDPANPGHFLELYDMPSNLYGEPVRVLLCDNATVERDGTRRRFGITVDARCGDAVEAAAWTFQLSREQYLELQRAT